MIDFIFNRRDFLRIGSLGLGLNALPFSDMALAQNDFMSANNKTVVLLWLQGGPSQFETFNAIRDKVAEPYRSVIGTVHNQQGHVFGGLFKELIKRGDKLSAVQSFSHTDTVHRQAVHWVMTSNYNPRKGETDSEYPGHGAVVSRVFGPNHPVNGLPSNISQGNEYEAHIDAQQPTYLGSAYKPYDAANKGSLIPKVQMSRFQNRRDLLNALGSQRQLVAPKSNEFNKLGSQAYDVLVGSAKDAFDLDQEPDHLREKYGKPIGKPGRGYIKIGEQLLLARRLAEFGTKFITINYGGWDMHATQLNIKTSLESRIPHLDKAVSAFVDDIYDRGINENILFIVTGEFGRTELHTGPFVNGALRAVGGGRDHHGAITPLLMSGGKYDHGRNIGKSDKSFAPVDGKVGPVDLKTTMFDHLQIPKEMQVIDQAGRPRYLLEEGGRVIL